jgi:uncharacterized tellurite resistance protein B-like protein
MPLDLISRLLKAGPASPLPPEDARGAIAAVLVMAARADHRYEREEKAAIDQALAERYDLTRERAAELRAEGELAEAASIDHYQFTRAIKAAVPLEERIGVVEALWRIVLADGVRDPHEDALLRQLADRLGLSPRELAEARQRAAG